ncbi:hypothetical protein BJ165DRAFT_1331794, partial [Panaeolus papilionaceus]
SKLPTKHRPFPIKEWIGRARSLTYRPDNINLASYEQDFKLWWASMQPAWRLDDGKVVASRVDGNWTGLRMPGINGLLNVVAALFYW